MLKRIWIFGWLLTTLVLGGSPASAELPYARHGWTDQEAAAHLLRRFTFGPLPGQVDAVARQGLQVWLEAQLTGQFADAALQQHLSLLPPSSKMSNEQLVALYPPPAQVRKMAVKAGVDGADRKEIARFRDDEGLRPPKELGAVLFAQKLYHARYGESQVAEMLTEFWYNHFNVALSNNRARPYVLSYERDILRPRALGSFRALLGATAKSPAMLWYLDNATSTASADAAAMGKGAAKRKKGLNENYARELMELHTLGVDGGYTQADVTEAARVLTGWTAAPYGRPQAAKKAPKGFVRDGDFVFAGPLHDAGSKKVLGSTFVAGGGQEEGERLLDMLALRPATARHMARKFAVRFVSDTPSEALVSSLAAVFLSSGGDTRAMVRAVARSDEFWAASSRGAKVKSPFELVVSAARILNAEVAPTPALYGWLSGMGQPLYNYQAPTGFPDRAEAWVSSGTVLARMNFGLSAARGGVLGFSYAPPALSGLAEVAHFLLPGQKVEPVVSMLTPMVATSDTLVVEAAGKVDNKGNLGAKLPGLSVRPMVLAPGLKGEATMIGLVLGSPEFQRR